MEFIFLEVCAKELEAGKFSGYEELTHRWRFLQRNIQEIKIWLNWNFIKIQRFCIYWKWKKSMKIIKEYTKILGVIFLRDFRLIMNLFNQKNNLSLNCMICWLFSIAFNVSCFGACSHIISTLMSNWSGSTQSRSRLL